MNRSFLNTCLLTVGLVAANITGAFAQEVLTSQVLYGGTRCDHVIHMILRDGVNNRHEICNTLVQRGPLGIARVSACELGDLQILQVHRLEQVKPACGPRFAIVIENKSTRRVSDFHVTAVAVFGRIHPFSPNTTIQVDEIAAGEALEIQLQLPIDALSMGNRNGRVLGFQRLVIAIDSYDELVESNEANNLKAYDVSAIPCVDRDGEPVGSSDPSAADLVPEINAPEETIVPAFPSSTTVTPSAPAVTGSIQSAIDTFETEGIATPQITPEL